MVCPKQREHERALFSFHFILKKEGRTEGRKEGKPKMGSLEPVESRAASKQECFIGISAIEE
jgi:hypothetical protein